MLLRPPHLIGQRVDGNIQKTAFVFFFFVQFYASDSEHEVTAHDLIDLPVLTTTFRPAWEKSSDAIGLYASGLLKRPHCTIVDTIQFCCVVTSWRLNCCSRENVLSGNSCSLPFSLGVLVGFIRDRVKDSVALSPYTSFGEGRLFGRGNRVAVLWLSRAVQEGIRSQSLYRPWE